MVASSCRPSAPICSARAVRAASALRQAILLEAARVAREPVRRDPRLEPVGRHGGERVQRVPQGLPDQLEPVEHLDRRQHMRRIGALPAPRLDQPRLLERRQQRLEQQRLGTLRDEAVAELAQDGGVEAGVVQRQAEGVLPVDAPAHRVGGLAIRQPFGELEDRRQGELRRGDRGLALLREEGGELRIACRSARARRTRAGRHCPSGRRRAPPGRCPPAGSRQSARAATSATSLSRPASTAHRSRRATILPPRPRRAAQLGFASSIFPTGDYNTHTAILDYTDFAAQMKVRCPTPMAGP